MPDIRYRKQVYTQLTDESVLECLLRHGVEAPHSCRSGVCQTCKMRVVDGEVPREAQKGLKPAAVLQGSFLPCVCRGNHDLVITDSDPAEFHTARVISKDMLNPTVVRLRLKTDRPLSYLAGQFVHLRRDDGLMRSYSLASLPSHDYLEFHVRHLEKGAMSSWIRNDLQPGGTLEISEPAGECIYVPGESENSILLIGTGTGLAPLYGVLQDALAQGHRGEIALFHGGYGVQDLYLVDELKQLSARAENFSYMPCVSDEKVGEQIFQSGRAADIALETFPQLNGWTVYLCGNPDMVNETRKKVFVAGASMQQIHSDPFVLGTDSRQGTDPRQA